MAVVLVAALAWVLLALCVALLMGRGIRLADERTPTTWTDEVERFLRQEAPAQR